MGIDGQIARNQRQSRQSDRCRAASEKTWQNHDLVGGNAALSKIKAVTLLFGLLLGPLKLSGKTPPIDYHEPPPDPPAAGQVLHNAPGQLAAPPIAAPLVGPGPFQQLPAIDESHVVALPVSKQAYWNFGKLDPVLTEACKLGDFVTAPTNRIIQPLAGSEGRAVLQVVPPLYRHLLYDRRNLARPGITYYFFDTARPSCEVRVPANVALRSFPPGRTTGLPPTDPRALQKKKALIKTWPK